MQEILVIICIINDIEGCNVAIGDIPGAFIQTDMVHRDCTVCVRICGVFADLLVKIYPSKFVEKVILEGGQKVIYVVLKKALYGALIVILLFWRDLSGALRSWGFEPNPCDICVMNKTVGGKQCTICWNVDDIKISHVRPKLVDEVLFQLTTKYGTISSLTVNQGHDHN